MGFLNLKKNKELIRIKCDFCGGITTGVQMPRFCSHCGNSLIVTKPNDYSISEEIERSVSDLRKEQATSSTDFFAKPEGYVLSDEEDIKDVGEVIDMLKNSSIEDLW